MQGTPRETELTTYEQALALVKDTVNEVLRQDGHPPVELAPETNILRETELDSMGLAIVVVQLEEKTGRDPFAQGFVNFGTVGELAELYAE